MAPSAGGESLVASRIAKECSSSPASLTASEAVTSSSDPCHVRLCVFWRTASHRYRCYAVSRGWLYRLYSLVLSDSGVFNLYVLMAGCRRSAPEIALPC